MNADEFGKTVQQRRKEEKLNQSQLAERIGISRNYISEIERGEAQNLSWDIKNKLCIHLGISIDPPPRNDPNLLPESLRKFAQIENLPDADLKMLSCLEYRGKQPDTVEKWKILYGVIKMTVESSDN